MVKNRIVLSIILVTSFAKVFASSLPKFFSSCPLPESSAVRYGALGVAVGSIWNKFMGLPFYNYKVDKKDTGTQRLVVAEAQLGVFAAEATAPIANLTKVTDDQGVTSTVATAVPLTQRLIGGQACTAVNVKGVVHAKVSAGLAHGIGIGAGLGGSEAHAKVTTRDAAVAAVILAGVTYGLPVVKKIMQ